MRRKAPPWLLQFGHTDLVSSLIPRDGLLAALKGAVLPAAKALVPGAGGLWGSGRLLGFWSLASAGAGLRHICCWQEVLWRGCLGDVQPS